MVPDLSPRPILRWAIKERRWYDVWIDGMLHRDLRKPPMVYTWLKWAEHTGNVKKVFISAWCLITISRAGPRRVSSVAVCAPGGLPESHWIRGLRQPLSIMEDSNAEMGHRAANNDVLTGSWVSQVHPSLVVSVPKMVHSHHPRPGSFMATIWTVRPFR